MPQSKEKVAPLRLPRFDAPNEVRSPAARERRRAGGLVDVNAESMSDYYEQDHHFPRRRTTLLGKLRSLVDRLMSRLRPSYSGRSQRFWGRRRKKRRRGRPDGTKGAGSRSI